MFTGLVEATGTVAAVEQLEEGARLSVATPLAADLADGDSVAVNGSAGTPSTSSCRYVPAAGSAATSSRATSTASARSRRPPTKGLPGS
jgi:riboflavin synthase alpha subunit